MKKMPVFVLIVFILGSMSTFLTGCAQTEMELLDAIYRTYDLSSYEDSTTMSIKMDIVNPSESSKQLLRFKRFLNKSKITINSKYFKNDETKEVLASADFDLNIADIRTNLSMFSSSGKSGTSDFQYILGVPGYISPFLPVEYSQKEYFTLGSEDLKKINPDLNNFDFSEMFLNDVFKTELIEFVKSYFKEFNPDFEIVSKKPVVIENGKEYKVYELFIGDDAIKKLIKYFGQNLQDNTKLLSNIKDSAFKIIDACYPEESREEYKKNVSDAINQMQENIPQIKNDIVAFADSLKDIKLLGDKGINVMFYVDENGYVSKIDGTLNIDIKAEHLNVINEIIKNIPGMEDNSNTPYGNDEAVAKFTLAFSSNLTNINSLKGIELPIVNDNNSVSLFQIIEESRNKAKMAMEESNDQYLFDSGIPNVKLDGEQIFWESWPERSNGRILVPVRDIARVMGFEVSWNDSEGVVTCSNENREIKFVANSNKLIVNGSIIYLDSNTQIINDKLYLPLRALSEGFGNEVQWDPSNGIANIITKKVEEKKGYENLLSDFLNIKSKIAS